MYRILTTKFNILIPASPRLKYAVRCHAFLSEMTIKQMKTNYVQAVEQETPMAFLTAAKTSLRNMSFRTILFKAFLPQNYPNSVFPQYTPFIKWLFFQNVMGAVICGI